MSIFKNFLIILLSVCLNYSVFADDKNFISKIAIIDIFYLLENSLAVKHVKNAMKVQNNNIASTLEAKEKELKLLEANIQKKSNIGNKNLDNEISFFQNKVKDVQKEIKEKNSALEIAYNKSMQKINDATTSIIKKLSEKYGFNVVIPSAQIYYASPQMDITEEVILLLNKELPTIEFKLEYKK
jgi:hypothetical protein